MQMRHVSLSVLTTWGSDHRRRERESPQRSKPEETQKLTTAFRHLLKFSLHNSVEISYYLTTQNTLREVRHSDVITGLFTEHSSAVAESQIKSTTTSEKSDSCSNRLPNLSAARFFFCRVHGLCLVPRENMTIFKNGFGYIYFWMWVFRLYPPPLSASSSFSPPPPPLSSPFSTTLTSQTIFLRFPKVPHNFLSLFYSHCTQTPFNLVSPSLMLSHSFPCGFIYSCCNFFYHSLIFIPST